MMLMQLFAQPYFILVEIILFNLVNSISNCDRMLSGIRGEKSIYDGGFKIQIEGNPNEYVPLENYNVSLVGIYGRRKFTAFILAVEKPELTEVDTIGNFQLIDYTSTQFSETCPNVITQTNILSKSEIHVQWTAPPPGSGCVIFRATVVEHFNIWYKDDDQLSLLLCENEQNSLNIPTREYNDFCCNCQEARYELIFEGLWSKNTHPKDFPSDLWSTKFSNIIGASHAMDYRFWDSGEYASPGLQNFAEHGVTTGLEEELNANGNKIRTLIKAHGLTYPNLSGKSFTTFRADADHPLISFVSKLDPSPDWIVGISGLNLCSKNCSWIENGEYKLHPYDVGTDSGYTYTSPDQPSLPHDHIKPIKVDDPPDQRSPFYDETKANMKPLARIYIKLQRLYEYNNCAIDIHHSEGTNTECALTDWTPWSRCSTACGKGIKTRERYYINHLAREKCEGALRIKPLLRDQQECEERNCGGDIESDCPVSSWSNWSPCSVSCGNGAKSRYRQLLTPHNRQNMGMYGENACANVELEEIVSCDDNIPCDETPEIMCASEPDIGYCQNITNRWFYDKFNNDCALFSYNGCGGNKNNFLKRETCLSTCKVPNSFGQMSIENLRYDAPLKKVNCKVSEWKVTPCNATCGTGYQIKTRTILIDSQNGGKPCPQLKRIKKCFMNCLHDNDICKYSEWTNWSPCLEISEGKWFRVRNRMPSKLELSDKCMDRIQRESCDAFTSLSRNRLQY